MKTNDALVALIPTKNDWDLARSKGWYRIPTRSAPELVRNGNVQFIAFYFPKAFGKDAYQISWYAQVERITTMHRTELFPEEPINEKSSKTYYILHLDRLQPLPKPIRSNKARRLIFIPTTTKKLFHAEEINDVFNASPLENKLYEQFKQHNIHTERQLTVQIKRSRFILDFAIFCKERNINVECDGDSYHLSPEQIKVDKVRNNYLASSGWQVLRFSTYEIADHLPETVRTVQESIQEYGGLILPTKE